MPLVDREYWVYGDLIIPYQKLCYIYSRETIGANATDRDIRVTGICEAPKILKPPKPLNLKPLNP